MKKLPYLETSHPLGRSLGTALRMGQASLGRSDKVRAAGRMRPSSGGSERGMGFAGKQCLDLERRRLRGSEGIQGAWLAGP